MNLSPEQQILVDSNEPVILAVCPPGSGKSRVLVERIKRLVRDGVDPVKICAVTFTNAGAKVMQERLCAGSDAGHGDGSKEADDTNLPARKERGLQNRVSPRIYLGHCGTLHSLMLRLLRQHHALVGLPEGVTVMDDDAAAESLEQCRRDLRVKCTDKALTEAVVTARNWMFTRLDLDNRPKPVDLAAREYHQRQKHSGELDFDSVLAWGVKLLMASPGLAGFTHVLWDEVQDSAPDDWDIMQAIKCEHLFMVGDLDQEIMSFRHPGHSNSKLLARKEISYKLLTLSTNYRSVPALVDLGQRLIRHNKERIDHEVKAADTGAAGDWCVFPHANPAGELAWIAQVIQVAPQHETLAVLFRTNFHADACREHLRGLGVPLVERKTVAKDGPAAVLGKALLAFWSNPFNDRAALKWILLRHGSSAAEHARWTAKSGLATVFSTCGLDLPGKPLDVNHPAIPPEVRAWITGLVETLPQPCEVADLLLAANRPEDAEPVGEGVVVSTAHASKGQEYDTVIIGGLEDDVWPSSRGEIEEERRLLFVAMTRARSRLCLSWCKSRPDRFRPWQRVDKVESRFLAEITGSSVATNAPANPSHSPVARLER